eukprot:gene1862-1003_t
MSVSDFGSDFGSAEDSDGGIDINNIDIPEVLLKQEDSRNESNGVITPIKIPVQTVLSDKTENDEFTDDEENGEIYDINEVLKDEEDEVPNSFDDFDEMTEESINKLLDSFIENDQVLTDYNTLELTTSDTTIKVLEELSIDEDDIMTEENQQEILKEILHERSHEEETYTYEPIQPLPKTDDEIEKEKEMERNKKAHSILKVDDLLFASNFIKEKRKTFGKPNVIHRCRKFMAIGMSSGTTLLFFPNEKVTPLIKKTKVPVCSVDVTPAGDFLFAGYANGDLVLWDTLKYTIVKEIEKEFNSPIWALSLLSNDRAIAASKDAIKLLNFQKIMFFTNVSSEEIVSDLYNENILQMKLLPSTTDDGPINKLDIAAIGLDLEVIVLTVAPVQKILYRLKKPIDVFVSSLPYISWKNGHSNRRPLLAIGWGKHLFFFKLVTTQDEFQLFNFASMEIMNDIVSVGWLGEQIIGVIDIHHRVSIIDPFSQQTVDKITVKDMFLNFHSRFDIITETSGIPRPSYHSSVFPLANTFTLLGMKGIKELRILKWNERIENLVNVGLWTEAIDLAMNMYKGKSHASFGLPAHSDQRDALISKSIVDLLKGYMETQSHIIKMNETNDEKIKINQIEQIGKIVIESSLEINKGTEMIFNILMSNFEKDKNIIFGLLEEYILSDKLTIIPQDSFEKFIKFYVEKDEIHLLQECILHLDITQINDEWLLDKCIKYEMKNVKHYIYNVVKRDYIKPLIELIQMSEESNLSYHDLYDYLNRTLIGKSTSEEKQKFLSEIFKIDKSKDNFERYTYLYPLLKFNINRFFEILESMYYDLSPKSAWISKHIIIHSRQSVADFLISIFYDSTIPPFNAWAIGRQTKWPTLADVSTFSIWLAQFSSKKIINIEIDAVHRIFSSVGYQYSNVINSNQVIYFEIIADLFWSELDRKNMIKNTEKILQKIAVKLCTESNNYEKAIDCILSNTELQTSIFDYVIEHIKKWSLKNGEELEYYQSIRKGILKHLTQLVQLDGDSTTLLVTKYFESDQQLFLHSLDKFPKVQYQYLKNLFGRNQSSELLLKKGFSNDQEIAFTYFSLLCQFEPQEVPIFLKGQTSFDIDRCLKLCQEYNIMEGSVYILERIGDIIGAFDLSLSILNKKIGKLRDKLMILAKEKDPNNDEYSFLIPFFYTNHEIDFGKSAPLIADFDVFQMNEYKDIVKAIRFVIESCKSHAEGGTLLKKEIINIWSKLAYSLNNYNFELRSGYIGKKEEEFCEQTKEEIQNNNDDDDNESIEKDLSDIGSDFGSDFSEPEDEVNSQQNKTISIDEDIEHHELILKKTKEELDCLFKELKLDYPIEKKKQINEQIQQKETKINSLEKIIKQLKNDKQKIEQEELNRLSDPTDPKNLPKLTSLWLQIAVDKLTKIVQEEITPLIYDNTELLNEFLNRYKNFELGQLKHDLLDFYGILQFQTRISEVVRKLLRNDEYFLYREFISKKRKGIRQKSILCFQCSNLLYNIDDEEKNKCVLFGCGHMYHLTCLIDQKKKCPICSLQSVKIDEKSASTSALPINSITAQKKDLEIISESMLKQYNELENNLKSISSLKMIKGEIKKLKVLKRDALGLIHGTPSPAQNAFSPQIHRTANTPAVSTLAAFFGSTSTLPDSTPTPTPMSDLPHVEEEIIDVDDADYIDFETPNTKDVNQLPSEPNNYNEVNEFEDLFE